VFTALDASINDAFKVLNDPNVRECHVGMRVIDILDQLSSKDIPPPFHSSRMRLVLSPPTIQMMTPWKRSQLR
jgi:hypothetical protein